MEYEPTEVVAFASAIKPSVNASINDALLNTQKLLREVTDVDFELLIPLRYAKKFPR